MSPEMRRSSHGRDRRLAVPFNGSSDTVAKEQSPNFVEDRGTSRRLLDEDRSLGPIVCRRSSRCSLTYDDHLGA